MTAICNSDKDCASKDTFGNCHSFDFCKHKGFKDIEKVNNPITFKVESVMCDYGIFENDQLMMIVNSRANALLIKSILQQDLKGKVVRSPFSTYPKRRRKLRAMTIGEYCDIGRVGRTECKYCEYNRGLYYCDYSVFNQVNRWREKNKPYKTKGGKYILREVKE
ncbi:hypothetical protein [Eubacterium sp.]